MKPFLVATVLTILSAGQALANYGYCTMCGYAHRNVPARYYRPIARQNATAVLVAQRSTSRPAPVTGSGRWVCVNGVCTWVPATTNPNPVETQARGVPGSVAGPIFQSPLSSSPEKDPAATTPQPVLDLLFRDHVHLVPSDIVYDLGCGDGRVCITAARFPIRRAIGIDLSPSRVSAARRRVRSAGLQEYVYVMRGDVTKLNLSKATVVYMYLYPSTIKKVLPRLTGCRAIISYMHPTNLPGERMLSIHGDPVFLWEPQPEPEQISFNPFLEN